MKNLIILFATLLFMAPQNLVHAQEYFLKDNGPFEPAIPSPEEFLGYPIGSHQTRYDQIVSYFEKLSALSNKAEITYYGKTYENRPLIILTVSSEKNIKDIAFHQSAHMDLIHAEKKITDFSKMPVFVNLGYGVHGNEPSSAEAAMLTAYTLVASQNSQIKAYLENSILFIDPTINPDGRDRHTHWVNMYKGDPLVDDPMDAEHNEDWPRGRTNHYWFDLNRDWLLAIHPESRGKLNWFHQWYPNVVCDFHEMGTNSTYFFEPMKNNASKDPIMPKENYTTLNDLFATYFREGLDNIGSLYFTKEVFDGTYPGYGSSYPDIQGGLALLFEQASSRGHIQKTDMGEITFAFTIRNQYVSSLATVKASSENKDLLLKYQQDFFNSALTNASKNKIKAYVFGDENDINRTNAFIDKLLIHQVEVYELKQPISLNGKSFTPGTSYIVPTNQAQYRMVQTAFETYDEFVDSVYYDASAWSLANFYNMPYAEVITGINLETKVTQPKKATLMDVEKSNYAYLISWDDYSAPAYLNYLQTHGARVSASFKPFTLKANGKAIFFDYGTLVIPVKKQAFSEDSLYNLIKSGSENFNIQAYSTASGYSMRGIDLGSGNIQPLEKPNVLLLIGEGISSSEAGEAWHLMDTRVHKSMTKVSIGQFDRIDFADYNTLIMVSGSYSQLDSVKQLKLKNWISEGNTLITIREASSWVIKQKLVDETLVEKKKDEKEEIKTERHPYVDARENIGKEQVGGAIFKVDLDLTHPLAFGYKSETLPVYRNSNVWLSPSKNPYSTVAKYTSDPLIDGFITEKNLNEFLIPSASLIVSKVGRGRVVMFADNPNFRGSWYGTNRLFLNAIFLGQHISIPGN